MPYTEGSLFEKNICVKNTQINLTMLNAHPYLCVIITQNNFRESLSIKMSTANPRISNS
jgi:hypothetical protein